MDFQQPIVFSDGSILPSRIFPAPMEGVTGGAWLKVLTRRRYVDCWWTPFLRISTAVPRMARLAEFLNPYLETGLPVIAQLMGTSAPLLAKAASALHRLGARVIDLNCACPSPAVLSNGAGGGRLRHPDWLREALLAMRQELGGSPMSIKLRCGYDSPDEFERTIAPAVLEGKPDMVTVHFRTVREGYQPIASGEERMCKIRQALPNAFLVGCGDVVSCETASAMSVHCGVDAVACARGMLKNPRLLSDIKSGRSGVFTLAECRDFLAEISACGAPRSFCLQLAGNFFGKDSPEFNKILHHETI